MLPELIGLGTLYVTILVLVACVYLPSKMKRDQFRDILGTRLKRLAPKSAAFVGLIGVIVSIPMAISRLRPNNEVEERINAYEAAITTIREQIAEISTDEIRDQLAAVNREFESTEDAAAYTIATVEGLVNRVVSTVEDLDKKVAALETKFDRLAGLLSSEDPDAVHELLELRVEVRKRKDYEDAIGNKLALQSNGTTSRLNDFVTRVANNEKEVAGINSWIRAVLVAILVAIGTIVAGAIYVERNIRTTIGEYRSTLGDVSKAMREELREFVQQDLRTDVIATVSTAVQQQVEGKLTELSAELRHRKWTDPS